jgi:GTPase SAR1 family protein
MKPVIALVGRPNVGKSTLFNRLTKTRAALVADFPGLTRDRHYGDGRVGPRDYIVIDTGGFEPLHAEGIAREMAAQAEQAIAEHPPAGRSRRPDCTGSTHCRAASRHGATGSAGGEQGRGIAGRSDRGVP